MDRSAVVSNGTVFGAWALGRSIAVISALLVITFVVIEPEASRGLGVAARTVFWVIHVGLGLISLYAASWLVLPHMMKSLPAWLVLLVAGTGGALLVTPLSYLVEHVLPASLRALEDEDEWLVVFASRGWWQAIAAEFLQLAPATLASWMIINLPFLAHRRRLGDAQDPNVAGSAVTVDLDKAEAGRYAESARAEFLSRLPESLGTNVIAISSDLHYLHVYTDLGHCMILGSLQQAADSMGEAGLRVHRSHWVAKRAIVKIVKKGNQWYCLLSNGLKIPISRRNKSTVAGWFGHTTRIVTVRKSSTEAG
ncbi:MAG TPA: LytTR family DNA-binding domain-containing protein [Gammaproteobacteria bacterium]